MSKNEISLLNISLLTAKTLKRNHYICGKNYKTIQDIPTFGQDYPQFQTHSFVNKISLWKGNITHLEIDAMVNAANEGLLGGGGIDEAIHEAAEPFLQRECAQFPLCLTGETRITKGYLLPATYVLHTVGPYLNENNLPQLLKLKQCYQTIFQHVKDYSIRTIALPSIATGFYGYPKQEAAVIAIASVLESWFRENSSLERVIFCLFNEETFQIYQQALFNWFSSNK